MQAWISLHCRMTARCGGRTCGYQREFERTCAAFCLPRSLEIATLRNKSLTLYCVAVRWVRWEVNEVTNPIELTRQFMNKHDRHMQYNARRRAGPRIVLTWCEQGNEEKRLAMIAAPFATSGKSGRYCDMGASSSKKTLTARVRKRGNQLDQYTRIS